STARTCCRACACRWRRCSSSRGRGTFQGTVRTLLPLSAMLASAIADAAAQPVRCEACLSLSPVVTLRTDEVPVVPSMAQSVLARGDASWLVSYLFTNMPVFVEFDAGGAVAAVHERRGQGPG